MEFNIVENDYENTDPKTYEEEKKGDNEFICKKNNYLDSFMLAGFEISNPHSILFFRQLVVALLLEEAE